MTSSIMELGGWGALQCGGSDLSYWMRCQHAHPHIKTVFNIYLTADIIVQCVDLIYVQVHGNNYYHRLL